MSHFPPPLTPPAKVGLFRRVPPAMFLPIFGLLGLVLAWTHGARAFSLSMGPVELATGMATALFLFGVGAYLAKFILRPTTCIEDLSTLPGRSGLAAMGLCWIVLSSLLGDLSSHFAIGLLAIGVSVNLAIAIYVTAHRLRGTDQAGPVTPGMHLVYVGFILIPGAAYPLGAPVWMLELICVYCGIAALILTVLTIRPLLTRESAPPLRPLQGIQLAPWALLTTSCILTGHPTLATIALICASVIAILLIVRLPWLIEGGFSGFWSAFTFPVAAFSGALLIYSEAYSVTSIRIAGGILLILVTLYIPVIAFKILKLWATGMLAIKTNAATV